MNNLLRSLRWLLPVVFLLLHSGCSRLGSKSKADTVIYIVRHAEKDLTPGLADPPLTPTGQERALALRQRLGTEPLSAIFSTNTARTRNTALPLAKRLNLSVENYDARQLQALAARIGRDYYGRTVLIVGHSNTILETAEAFGATRPVPVIGDDQYDFLLKVTLPRGGQQPATAVAERYGAGR